MCGGNHGTCVGVSYQSHRTTGSLQYAMESGDVIGEGCEGNRRARYREPMTSQRQNDASPAGSVSPCSVNQARPCRFEARDSLANHLTCVLHPKCQKRSDFTPRLEQRQVVLDWRDLFEEQRIGSSSS